MSDLVEQVARAIAGPMQDAWQEFMTEAEAALSVLEPRIEQLERELAEARAELERRARNENRNCLNWGPCSAHDGRMAEVAAIRTGEAEQ